MLNGIKQTESGAIVAEGREGVGNYQALVIAKACEFYAKHKMQVNRAYTPTRMLKAAEHITGIKYKRGQHAQAAQDIRDTLIIGCAPHQMAAREQAQG